MRKDQHWNEYEKINTLQLDSNKAFYDKTYKKYEKDFQSLKKSECISILDIGCGNGENTKQYLHAMIDKFHYKKVKVYMLDPSNTMLKKAKTTCKNHKHDSCEIEFTFHEESAETFLNKGKIEKFDVVCSFYALQWVATETQEKLLNNAGDILNTNGVLMAYYPSKQAHLDEIRYPLLNNTKSLFYIEDWRDGLNFQPPKFTKSTIKINEENIQKEYKSQKEFSKFIKVVMPECNSSEKWKSLPEELKKKYADTVAKEYAELHSTEKNYISFEISVRTMASTHDMRHQKQAESLSKHGTFKGKETSVSTSKEETTGNIGLSI